MPTTTPALGPMGTPHLGGMSGAAGGADAMASAGELSDDMPAFSLDDSMGDALGASGKISSSDLAASQLPAS